MVDLQRLIDNTQMKGVTVWVEYPKIPGFTVEIAFVGKQEMLRIYDESTTRQWNSETRKNEEELDRRKVSKVWGERVVKSWKGLTIAKLQKIWPVKLVGGENPETEIEPSQDNRVALLWNSTDFENWVLSIATSADHFADAERQAQKEFENLEK